MSGIRRGEVWWAELGAARGSEPAFRRPVLVVQSDRFNDSRIQTAIVAVITSNVRLGDAPGNVRLAPHDSGLAKPSVVNVSQLLTVSRRFLDDRVGRLSPRLMNEVADGLRLTLAL
ncbi:MAG TPA: type II toxin-antitoxin system PemK/MazF family toxin [Thermoanaerobaculia bacterium]|nr:type II toxin-antitoxin system PemK/MazF family toxin [Thermoanaerobaculia bacterium]